MDLPAGDNFQRVHDYPNGFLEIAEDGPPGPWMYTGALENRPELVARISAQRLLWGNPAEVLTEIRSPERVYQVLRDANIPCPNVRTSAGDLPDDGWLLKPQAGSAGQGIRDWAGKPERLPSRCYLQERIVGEACAAIYVGFGTHAEYIGTTRQLVGENWLRARSFQYCGSIGPLPLAPSLEERLQHLGSTLAAAFHLRGLFGVDCILRDGIPFPVEVNPRYTASVEVLELAGRTSLLDLHRRAVCVSDSEGTLPKIDAQPLIGKAILFARASLLFPAEGPWLATPVSDPWVMPSFADIPAVGTLIPRGKPILTFFSSGRSIDDCEVGLRRIAYDLDRLLFGP
jgi:predicted ATP-grasp superfamily ATP-dependent carboligase